MDHEEFALERLVVRSVGAGADEQLTNDRRCVASDPADLIRPDWHVPPAESGLALAFDARDEQLLELCAAPRVLRKKADERSVTSGFRQLDSTDGAQ
jgi:hypothetical protein